jgi:hypothetical protein
LRTTVRILRGQHRGREGWIAGDLASRAARGVTKALVHIDGVEPEFFATSSLEASEQLTFSLPVADREGHRTARPVDRGPTVRRS